MSLNTFKNALSTTFMHDKLVVGWYLRISQKIIPIKEKSKARLLSGDPDLPTDQLLRYPGELAWQPSFPYFVIDVDCAESYAKLKKDYKLSFIKTVDSQTKGHFHIYCRLENKADHDNLKGKLSNRGYEGVDLIKANRYVLIPTLLKNSAYKFSQDHPDTNLVISAEFIKLITKEPAHAPTQSTEHIPTQSTEQSTNHTTPPSTEHTTPHIIGASFQEPAHPAGVSQEHIQSHDLISADASQEHTTEPVIMSVEQIMHMKKKRKITDKQMIHALYQHPAVCSYAEWIKIGMGLHDYKANKKGFTMFLKWSAQAKDKYQDYKYACEKAWDSFKIRRDDGITYKSVLHNTKPLKKLKTKQKAIESPPSGLKGIFHNIFYDQLKNKYINIETQQEWSKEGFNTRFYQEAYFYAETLPSICFKYIGKDKIIDDHKYTPTNSNTLIFKKCANDDHIIFYNNYNKHNIIQEDKNTTEEARLFVDCIKLLCFILSNKDEKTAGFLFDWLAFQVKFPGVKMHWMPVLISNEGLGKSTFGDIACMFFGDVHTNVVPIKRLLSDFNEWSVNSCINVLPELKIQKKHLDDVIDTLKIVITDKMLNMNAKYQEPKQVVNCTNYIAFTNNFNPIPKITEQTRRFWFVLCTIKNPTEDPIELDEIIQNWGLKGITDHKDFFNFFITILNNTDLSTSYARKCKYIIKHEHEISAEFMKCAEGTPPPSTYKQQLIQKTKDDIEALEEIEELIQEENTPYVHEKIIFRDAILHALKEEYDLEIKNYQLNKAMQALGFIYRTNSVKLLNNLKPLERFHKRNPDSQSTPSKKRLAYVIYTNTEAYANTPKNKGVYTKITDYLCTHKINLNDDDLYNQDDFNSAHEHTEKWS